MGAYRKKPVVIEAEQFLGWYGTSFSSGLMCDAGLHPFSESSELCECGSEMKHHMQCPTLEGKHIACPNDWIIKGVKGEFYPCKPDIFELTYEKVL